MKRIFKGKRNEDGLLVILSHAPFLYDYDETPMQAKVQLKLLYIALLYQ